MNTNCLEGMKCPKCGSDGPFRIAVTTIAIMYDDGSDSVGDLRNDDSSFCGCEQCGYERNVRAFKQEPTYQCDDCSTLYANLDQLDPIEDREQRVDAGGEEPSGQCPECGALCYMVVEGKDIIDLYRRTAQRMYEDEAELLVYPDAKVLISDDQGAYVEMYGWVPNTDLNV